MAPFFWQMKELLQLPGKFRFVWLINKIMICKNFEFDIFFPKYFSKKQKMWSKLCVVERLQLLYDGYGFIGNLNGRHFEIFQWILLINKLCLEIGKIDFYAQFDPPIANCILGVELVTRWNSVGGFGYLINERAAKDKDRTSKKTERQNSGVL